MSHDEGAGAGCKSKEVRRYGTWPSPLTESWLTAAGVRLSGPTVHSGVVYWVEGRPEEAGRSTIMRQDAGGPVECVPAPFNVRSRVHEYGAGPYAVHGTSLWFVDDGNGQIFHTLSDGVCRAVTAPGPWRFGDLTFDRHRARLLAVAEQHQEGREMENVVVQIDVHTGKVETILRGHDFFAAPRLSPSGDQLAFLAWNHPNMPWDAAALYVAKLENDGKPETPEHVAGDAQASAFGPTWSPEGVLAFAWEPHGYWNLYTYVPGEAPQCLLRLEAEFALPLWQLGMSTFGWLDPNMILTALTAAGRWQIARVDCRSGDLTVVTTDLPSISHLYAANGRAVAVGAAPNLPASVIEVSPEGRWHVLRCSQRTSVELQACITQPETIQFPTSHGHVAHGFFYPPWHSSYVGPASERPPLLVMVHGGPTAATSAAFNPSIHYWTTRGFAVLDVNYRGSTGYGRAYRSLLDGQWGIFDVQDCVAGARHVAELGLVDAERLAIRGSSAGGFTVLAALTFHNTFAAGASLYGVGDLEALVRDTHKFESRYLDRLVGPYPAEIETYRRRSPLFAIERLTAPVIFFQGLDDKVVPPNQAEAMVTALKERGVEVRYFAFEGEQHGFRKAETIRKVHLEELAFYGDIFGFVPAPPDRASR